jgi:hypothetical protein
MHVNLRHRTNVHRRNEEESQVATAKTQKSKAIGRELTAIQPMTDNTTINTT